MANAILFGKYHLIDRISAGGMAEVFRAKSYGVAGFEKILVIKKILPHLSKDREFIDMFLDEARISVSLSHANIVQVIDLGKEGDSYFMALEYVHGQDLSRAIVQGRKSEVMDIKLSLYVACEVLKALDYAHRRKDRNYKDLNIVHCDVSPQNILLSYEGEVKLTDFGISKAAFQSASSQGVVRGKYAYMSPEQVEGKGLDRRSDIYSVGIILFELLTGKRLFKRDSVDKTLRAVVSAPVPSIRDLNKNVDEQLERIVLKALAKDRDKRSTDAAELLEDLSGYMFSRSIHVTSMDLASYLLKIFQGEERGSESPLELGRSSFSPLREPRVEGEPTPRPVGKRLFIPAHTGVSIPTYTHRDTGQPALLRRINVAVLALEWFIAPPGDMDKAHRSLHERLQARIKAMHGELWDIHHTGLVAVWRLQEDPVGSVTEAIECALALKDDEFPSALGDFKGSASLVQVLHAGTTLLERETNLPLGGWPLTKTFVVPRFLVNQKAPGPCLMLTSPVEDLVGSRFDLVESSSALGVLPGRFELLGRRDPDGPGPRVAWSNVTRYLGQEQRITSLEQQLKEAVAGHPSVALFLGDEGSGRGRQEEWLFQNGPRLGAAVYFALVGPDGRDTAYGAIRELLSRVVGIQPIEAAASEQQKLARLAQLGLGQEEIALLGSLFDEQTPADEARGRRRERIQAAVERMVAGLCRDQGLVLIFDEIQWLDPLSSGVVRHLINALGRRRLLIVLAGPAGMEIPWLGGPAVHTWRCEAMPSEMIEALVCDMLACSSLAPVLLQEIQRRSGGNPFWVKTIVAELADGGHIRVNHRRAELAAGSWPLPGGRPSLDRHVASLPDTLRETLARLACLGQNFPLEGAQLALGAQTNVRDRLRPAVERGLLRERQMERTFYYRFRHSSLPELLLASLDPGARQDIARKVAAAIKEQPLYLRGQRTELLARCMEHEGGPGAARVLEAAGDRLLYERGYSAALRWYGAALSAEREPPRHRAIRRKMARTHLEQGSAGEAESILRQCLDLARRAGTPAEVGDLLLELGLLLQERGNLRGAVDLLRDGVVVAGESRQRDILAEVHRHLGECLRLLGQVDESQQHLKTGFAMAQEAKDRALLVRHAYSVGESYLQAGDYRRAHNNFLRCFQVARELKSRELIQQAITGIALTYHHVGQYEQALKAYKESLGLAQELDDPLEQAYVSGRMGAVYAEMGKFDRAEHPLRVSLMQARQQGHTEIVLYAQIYLGYTRVCLGDRTSGLREVEDALRQAQEKGFTILVALGHLYLGNSYAKIGDDIQAVGVWKQAMQEARTQRLARVLREAALALHLDAGPAPTLDAAPLPTEVT